MNLLDLSILNWTLNSSQPGFQPIPAEVPGDNYSALLKNGIIPDPNLKMNEIDVQFYREHDWTFSTEFEISREFLDKRSVFLNIDSPDTFAVVRINGKKAAESKNMFRRLRAEVKPFLQCGKNTLEIEFASPERIAKELFDKLPFPLPYVSDNRVPHQNLIRKMQCASGWDWGICLLTSGIAGKVSC